MNELTIYDLMAEDHYVIARKAPNNLLAIEVLNEDDKVVFETKSHRYAWESLVSFAKKVLQQDEMIQKEIANE